MVMEEYGIGEINVCSYFWMSFVINLITLFWILNTVLLFTELGIPITGHEGPQRMWMQGSTFSATTLGRGK